MKSFAFDLYGGMIDPQQPVNAFSEDLRTFWKSKGEEVDFTVERTIYNGRLTMVVTGNAKKTLPTDAKQIVGWERVASTFAPRSFPYRPGMHVDTYCSFDKRAPGDKQGPNSWGLLKTGDAGHDSKALMGIALDVPAGLLDFYISFWVHNMGDKNDWHCGYIIFYV